MARAYIGIGANLKDPAAQVRDAIARIAARPQVKLVAESPLYRSAPLGPGKQADYCNAVCAVETALTPDELLTSLHDVERSMGRERPPLRWAPRLIDLDLLHYDGIALKTARLTLPHPEMHKRNFVLAPLAQIAPELELPGLGRTGELAKKLGTEGLRLWSAA
jgi:2-amino-4-hydroxy-6-hydroxymethyldihydropteridine diphosphokinase